MASSDAGGCPIRTGRHHAGWRETTRSSGADRPPLRAQSAKQVRWLRSRGQRLTTELASQAQQGRMVWAADCGPMTLHCSDLEHQLPINIRARLGGMLTSAKRTNRRPSSHFAGCAEKNVAYFFGRPLNSLASFGASFFSEILG